MEITFYSVIVGLGASLGLAWVAWRAREREREYWVDAGLWVLLGVLLGARLVFVGVNWSYFQSRLGEAPLIWQGGLSWSGGFIGGLLAAVGLSIRWQVGLGALVDGFLPLAVILSISAWLAGWMIGSGYGFTVTSLWLGLPGRDEWGVYRTRFPTQLVGALLTLILFLALDQNRQRLSEPGQFGSLGLTCMAVVQGILVIFNAEPVQTWHGWSLDAWSALLLGSVGLLSFALVTWIGWRRRKAL